jgi:hypothetical protein
MLTDITPHQDELSQICGHARYAPRRWLPERSGGDGTFINIRL